MTQRQEKRRRNLHIQHATNVSPDEKIQCFPTILRDTTCCGRIPCLWYPRHFSLSMFVKTLLFFSASTILLSLQGATFCTSAFVIPLPSIPIQSTRTTRDLADFETLATTRILFSLSPLLLERRRRFIDNSNTILYVSHPLSSSASTSDMESSSILSTGNQKRQSSNSSSSVARILLSPYELEQKILKLGRCGKFHQAMDLYQQYQSNNTSIRVLNAILDVCARAKRLDKAKELFQQATTKKSKSSLTINVYTFGALMNACNRVGNPIQAILWLKEMQSIYHIQPNAVVYSSAISACARAIQKETTTTATNNKKKTMDDDVNNNHHTNTNIQKYKSMALSLLKEAVETKRLKVSVIGFNAAISACAQAADYRNAIKILQRMQVQQQQIQQQQHNNSIPIPATTTTKNQARTHLTTQSITTTKNNTSTKSNTNTTTASTTTTTSNVSSSSHYYVPEPDVVTYGTVLAACEKSKQWKMVLEYAKLMQQYFALDGLAIMSCLHACAELGYATEAMQYLSMLKNLLTNISNQPQDQKQQKQHYIGSGGMGGGTSNHPPLQKADAVAYHVAIIACARGGAWQDGIRLLHECRTELGINACNVITYTSAINGCEYAGEWKQAFALLELMRNSNVQPNELTMGAVLGACATACAKHYEGQPWNGPDADNDENDSASRPPPPLPYIKGMQLFQILKKDKTVVKPNIQIYNAAIRLCAEARQIDQAFRLVHELHERNMARTQVTYGSLLTACQRVGNVEKLSLAFRLLKGEEEKVKANEIMYGAAISCCRKAKEPERALLLLQRMMQQEGLSPNTACFNTVMLAQVEQAASSKHSKRRDKILLQLYKWMKSQEDSTVSTGTPSTSATSASCPPNRQTYNILIKYFATTNQPAIAQSLLTTMKQDSGYQPDVDLFTATVAAYERTQQPLQAIQLLQHMEKEGYDFYSVKVLNAAFKKAVNLVNAVGKQFVVAPAGSTTTTATAAATTITDEFHDDDDDDADVYHLDDDNDDNIGRKENTETLMS